MDGGFSKMPNTKQVPELWPQVDNFPPVLDEYEDQIVTEENGSLTINLHNRDGHGLKNLGTPAEETIDSKNAVEITFRCSGLEHKDLISYCFLKISRIVETGGSVPISWTERVLSVSSPIWEPVCLILEQFGSKETELLIECFDVDICGDLLLIGKLQKSVADLEKLHRGKVGANFVLPLSGDYHREKGLEGQLFVDAFSEKKVNPFGPWLTDFFVRRVRRVDSTASNGNRRNPYNFPNIDPSGRSNFYQQAIMEVGEVLQFYDSYRVFPAWGFGGKIPNGVLSDHCSHLNGNPNTCRNCKWDELVETCNKFSEKIRKRWDFDIGGSIRSDNVGHLYSGLDGGGEVTNQEATKRQMEVLWKNLDEALKAYNDSIGRLQKNGEDVRIDIGPDNNADPTSGYLQLMKKTAESSTLNKVNEIVLATSAQGAFSLIAYASINSSSTKLTDSPALLGAVGANAVAFATSLTSLCLRDKKRTASSFLAKIGALAVIAAVIGAMAMYIPVNIQWLATFAAALPAIAVIYA